MNQPEPQRSSGARMALTLLGLLLMLPGLCSLFVALDTKLDPKEPMFGTLIAVWITTFGLAVLGIALMYIARKNAADAEPPPG